MRKLGLVSTLLFLAVWVTTTAAAQSERSPQTPRRPRTETSTETATPTETASPSGSESGARPPAPMGLARSKVRSHVETSEPVIALTLDDGYHPDSRILDLIASYHLHGTAFVVGQVADANPDFVRRVTELGWMVCSHTYDHKQLTSLEEWQIRDEIVRGMEAVERVVGYRCPYFRVPYGSVNARIAAVTDSLDLQLVGWDASLSDSAPTGTDPDKQVRLALRSIRPGSILLGHFGATNSYVVLRRVIDSLLESGYRIGSLSELIRGDVPPPQLTVLAETTPSSRGASAARSSAAGVVRRVDWKGMLAASGQIAAGLALILLAAFGVWRGHVRRRRFARRVQLELEFQPVMTTVTSPIFTEDDPALSLASTPVDENVVESTPWSS